MKDLLKPALVNRDWNKQKAQRKYEAQLDAIETHHQSAVDNAYNVILSVVTTSKPIMAYGRDALLMQLAQLGGIRLYDSRIDSKNEYTKRKQGEHQLAMSDALDAIITEKIAILIIEDAHNPYSLHTVRHVPTEQPARPRTIFDDDGHCRLNGQHMHKMREWREEPQL